METLDVRDHVQPPPVISRVAQGPPTEFTSSRHYTEEEVKIAFDTYDLDKNKFVGASELRYCLGLIGEKATDEEIDEMVRMCDTDGDGQVTFNEFRKMIMAPQTEAEPQPRGEIRQTRGLHSQSGVLGNQKDVSELDLNELMEKYMDGTKLKASFLKGVYKFIRQIDRKGEGLLSFEDFCSVMGRSESEFMKALFKAFDLDGSGTLETREFLVVLSSYTSSSKTDKLKFSFMMFDEDGSGFLERDEFLQLLRANFHSEPDHVLEKKVNEVFRSVHQPPDGKVSYDNFMTISRSHPGLVFPIKQSIHTLSADTSIDQLLEKPKGEQK